MAKSCGVDHCIVDRAYEIFWLEYAPLNGLRLLSVYVKLLLRLPIPGFGYNLAAQLRSDQQRSKTAQYLERALWNSGGGDSGYNLQLQLLRMKGDSAPIEAIQTLITSRIESEIAQRKRVQLGRKSTKTLMRNGPPALRDVVNRFSAVDASIFLASGTLLGAIRDREFVNNDMDIDLGVFQDMISKSQVRKLMAGSPFSLVADQEFHLGYRSWAGVSLEIFFTERRESSYVMRNFSGIIEWHFSPFDLSPIEFFGSTHLAPHDRDKNLTQNYGNWRDRVIFYDYVFDVPCAKFASNSEALIFMARKLGTAVETGDRFTAQKCIELLKSQYDLDQSHLLPVAGDRPELVTD